MSSSYSVIFSINDNTIWTKWRPPDWHYPIKIYLSLQKGCVIVDKQDTILIFRKYSLANYYN